MVLERMSHVKVNARIVLKEPKRVEISQGEVKERGYATILGIGVWSQKGERVARKEWQGEGDKE
jgi:hypothetical protein